MSIADFLNMTSLYLQDKYGSARAYTKAIKIQIEVDWR